MSTKRKNRNKMHCRGQIFNAVHRLVELIARGIFLLIAYLKGPAQSQPPIKDLTLLHSATTLAFKIRNRQASIVFLSAINGISLNITII